MCRSLLESRLDLNAHPISPMFLRCRQAQAGDPFGLERYPLREREGSITQYPSLCRIGPLTKSGREDTVNDIDGPSTRRHRRANAPLQWHSIWVHVIEDAIGLFPTCCGRRVKFCVPIPTAKPSMRYFAVSYDLVRLCGSEWMRRRSEKCQPYHWAGHSTGSKAAEVSETPVDRRSEHFALPTSADRRIGIFCTVNACSIATISELQRPRIDQASRRAEAPFRNAIKKAFERQPGKGCEMADLPFILPTT